MDIKQTIQFVIIALVVSIFTNVLMPAKMIENLGGNTIHPLIEDFVAGIKVNGTTFIDSSRNVAAGTISGTTGTLTGLTVSNTAASTSVTLGDNTYKSLCLKAYTTSGLAYVYFSTSTVNGAVVVTTTKPTMCP